MFVRLHSHFVLKPGVRNLDPISLNVFAFKSYSPNKTFNQVSKNSNPCFNEQDFGLVDQ